MHWLNRRDFLKDLGGVAALAAGASLLPEASQAAQPAPRGANERLNIACIGVRGQGFGHVGAYAGKNNCVVTHVCDVDSAVVGRVIEAANKAQGRAPEHVVDIRRLLENKEIHAVSIATPNHWHALAAIWAMQAGKDVYVEKPVSHNISEGRRIVEVARRLGRICQGGTQNRSNGALAEAVQYMRSGKLGEAKLARSIG